MRARQNSDNDAWDQKDDGWDEAVREASSESRYRQITAFVERVFEECAMIAFPIYVGGSHVSYPIRFGGSPLRVVVRLPLTDQTTFAAEKLFLEAATTECLSRQSQLSVPRVYHYGMDPEVGAFSIIQDYGARTSMCELMWAQRPDEGDMPILSTEISEERLKMLYLNMARCVLQIAQPAFPLLGSLVGTTPGSCAVLARPITLNMSSMVQLSNIPESVLPSPGSTYQSADDWYVALADMHIATLLFQHNDIVSSEDDCRCKYVARQLFRRRAKQGQLSNFGFAEDDWSARSIADRSRLAMPPRSGSFRLWNDHFRPSTVLMNESEMVHGLIDWEFTYAAPTHFVLDCPWWLLLEWPEEWEDGIEEWVSIYETRLGIWLSALEDVEGEMGPGSFCLSTYMRDSWKTGRFWLNYAARNSWAFDSIYWKYLDELFFGAKDIGVPHEKLWETRLHLLTDEERAAMEPLVQIKMAKLKERTLIDWKYEEAKQRMSSFLFD
ncbi:Phosphotransferase [Colletotrichum asianum]